MTSPFRRGFTLLELAVLLAVSGTGLLLMASTGALGTVDERARQVQDAGQIRDVVRSMTFWASQNDDTYPLPSAIDRQGFTVREAGTGQDTSSNIMSMLVYNGSIPVGHLISPVETNAGIAPDDDYVFFNPPSAVDPDRALWDPAFDADFTDGAGNLSYAHLLPSGERLPQWGRTFDPSQPAMMTRGPQIASVQQLAGGSVRPALATPASNTIRFFASSDGARGNAWSTNVCFNDTRVEFWSDRIARPSATDEWNPIAFDNTRPSIAGPDGTSRPDLLSYDESSHPANAYLGIFTTAGDEPKDFKPIWD